MYAHPTAIHSSLTLPSSSNSYSPLISCGRCPKMCPGSVFFSSSSFILFILQRVIHLFRPKNSMNSRWKFISSSSFSFSNYPPSQTLTLLSTPHSYSKHRWKRILSPPPVFGPPPCTPLWTSPPSTSPPPPLSQSTLVV